MASTISDRATDEVLEALTRYKRGLGIPENDSPYDDTLVSDIVRSQSSHVSIEKSFLLSRLHVTYLTFIKINVY